MSIATEITRLQTAKDSLKTAIEGKGVTVPSSTKLDGYATLVDSIEQGGGDDFLTLPSEFPISASKKVKFSRGNLQAIIDNLGVQDTYNYSASGWKFAANQWDYIGNNAGNNSLAPGSVVDLFGWVGTSASYDTYGLCTKDMYNNEYYGTSDTDSLKTDWGSIPGVIANLGTGWRTLSLAEWNYLIIRRSHATVNGTTNATYIYARINTDSTTVYGVVLFPDDVTIANGEATSWSNINSGAYWSKATNLTTAQWTALEAKGCVFLPITCYRSGTTVNGTGKGYYWSSDVSSRYYAYAVKMESGYMLVRDEQWPRCNGAGVRLVKEVS